MDAFGAVRIRGASGREPVHVEGVRPLREAGISRSRDQRPPATQRDADTRRRCGLGVPRRGRNGVAHIVQVRRSGRRLAARHGGRILDVGRSSRHRHPRRTRHLHRRRSATRSGHARHVGSNRRRSVFCADPQRSRRTRAAVDRAGRERGQRRCARRTTWGSAVCAPHEGVATVQRRRAVGSARKRRSLTCSGDSDRDPPPAVGSVLARPTGHQARRRRPCPQRRPRRGQRRLRPRG